MNDAEILQLLEEALAFASPDEAKVKLRPDATIADLGISSITVLEIVGYVEEKLAVRFPDDALAHLNTVRSMMDMIQTQGIPAQQEERA